MARRKATVTEMPLRREPSSVEDFSESEDDIPLRARSRSRGVRVSFTGGLVPASRWGRIGAACGLLAIAGAVTAAVLAARSFLLHDPHFLVETSSAIEIAGNSHLSRPQLLSVFGGDVAGNIFRIPLDERRAQLESLPWVQHATVMRLLPGRVRVAIQERTPVAFVRQGRQIGLVDANGVLLDLGPADSASSYSFPVVTGINASDPLSTRAARMKLYQQFLLALDATGESNSRKLSEIDMSDPEDIRALVPDPSSGTDLLVHFGDDQYLDRFHRYQEHLAEWHQQYPHLASVDLRYDQQAVLQMQPGTAPTSAPPAAPVAVSPVKPVAAAAHAAPAKPSGRPATPPAKSVAAGHAPVPPAAAHATAPPARPAAARPAAARPAAAPTAPSHHLTQAFDVPSTVKPKSTSPAGPR
jgi:cell division protein FtsQ